MRRFLPFALLPLLTGCVVGTIASAAVEVATLPVKAAAKAVDLATTSQSEADEKRGRELRKAEEQAGRDARKAEQEGGKVEFVEDAPPPQSR